MYGEEIPKVIECLRLRLERLLEAEENPARAKIAFRALYRLIHGGPGRPMYPEFSWGYLSHFLDNFDTIYKPDTSG
jgi:hypothetical protein